MTATPSQKNKPWCFEDRRGSDCGTNLKRQWQNPMTPKVVGPHRRAFTPRVLAPVTPRTRYGFSSIMVLWIAFGLRLWWEAVSRNGYTCIPKVCLWIRKHILRVLTVDCAYLPNDSSECLAFLAALLSWVGCLKLSYLVIPLSYWRTLICTMIAWPGGVWLWEMTRLTWARILFCCWISVLTTVCP